MTSSQKRKILLEHLHRAIRDCRLCELHKTRTQAVPGAGNSNAKIFFVGEAPGQEEDFQGEPFVGAAGKLLTQLLHQIGLSREEVFIGNVLKCRPPENRDPRPEEIQACRPYLLAQMTLINPKLICPLGTHALQALYKEKASIGQWHGQLIIHENMRLFPIYHPAAALHGGKKMREALEKDFQALKKVLELLDDENFNR